VGPETPTAPHDDGSRFGTQAFYAAIGRALVVMCGVVPVLAFIEFVRQETATAADARTASGFRRDAEARSAAAPATRPPMSEG